MHKVISKVYTVTDLPFTSVSSDAFVSGDHEKDIRKRIQQVIEEEAPITEWLLIKRVINSFNIWKAGTNIRTYMKKILDSMPLHTTQDPEQVIYWKRNQDKTYSVFRLFGRDELACRDALQLPCAECANAVVYTANRQPGLTMDELVRQTALLMGYTRIGSNVGKKMNEAVRFALKKKWIKGGAGGYTAV
ncbi:MAG: DUF3320 domain-containing protein [Solobacterium sp.]|nr:DUF3320 domain-containing protein [Solobacterium sp.]